MDVAMNGCVPPVHVLLRLCVSVQTWLSGSPGRHLIVHGAKATKGDTSWSFGPAALLLGCYLSWIGLTPHPLEGAAEVCDALGITDKAVCPSQKRYLQYFELLHRGFSHSPSKHQARLSRVAFVGMGGDGIRRVLEIWQQDKKLFKENLGVVDKSGVIVQVTNRCVGDLVIQVLCVERGSGRRPWLEFRACLNTAFVEGGYSRFESRDLDVPGSTDPLVQGISVDAVIEEGCTADDCPQNDDKEAVQSGPKVADEPCTEEQEDFNPACEDSLSGKGKETLYFDLTMEDAELCRMVFAPDDVDAFFNELG